MATKRFPADDWFSKCVRERAGWTCERCGSVCPPDKKMGFHCAHYMGRGNWSTRFDPQNAAALCYGCHRYIDGNRSAKDAFFASIFGEVRCEIIQQLSKQPARGIKRKMPEIAAHYRAELKRMEALRAEGYTGRLEFESWA